VTIQTKEIFLNGKFVTREEGGLKSQFFALRNNWPLSELKEWTRNSSEIRIDNKYSKN